MEEENNLKKINKIRRGKRFEKKVKEYLEKRGYFIEKKPWLKYLSKDFFNLYDFIGYNPDSDKLIFVQAKKNKKNFTYEVLKNLKLLKIKKIEILIFYSENKKIKFEKLEEFYFENPHPL